jgi:Tfp pilus assembly protein PilF
VALSLIYLAVRFTVADRALALARRGVESGDLAAATVQYDRYQRWHLPGTAADLWYSRELLNLAMSSPIRLVKLKAALQSVSAGLRATRTAEEPFDAWYSLAEVYAAENDPVRTESCLRAAIAARPDWFKPHWALAQLLRMESRLDDAGREATLAADLNGGKNPEVARTLAEITGRPEHK